MKVSIIIPHYNSWEKLWELLLTIPRAEIFETIVVDDHSENFAENEEKINLYFPNVIMIENSIGKKGAGSARNNGLKIATGKWILFADSDDMFQDDLIFKIREYYDSEYEIVYFTPISIIDNGVSKRHIQYEKYVVDYLKDSNRKNKLSLKYKFIVPWSKMIRKSIIDENQIEFQEVMYSNDILFSVKVGYYASKIAASSQIIYIIRETEGSLTTIKNSDVFMQRYYTWLDYALFLKSKLPQDDFLNLNITISSQILNAIKYKVSLSELYLILKLARKNSLSILDRRLLNVKFLFEKIQNSIR
ncbi:glycosyltransferase family 2 protein [Fundicoccus sp. Sow4_D5]|uniref:glycosyltransferase family 2 protein n=1 Tax=Fundicoccus sp. Sow4_D5 TaxID=3438782 RepID=UPI003F9322A4